jgi:hypothetical protein
MAVTTWTNVAVAIESSAATALTISGITKASPGVVTYTGTDPSNGDYVKLSVQGMNQVDGRVFRVANVNAGSNTFELESENTTAFNTFSSGTCQVLTFGTSLSTATSLSASGGEFSFIDTTTIHDSVAKQIPGLASAATYTFESIWDVSDAGLVALKAASDAQAQKGIRFTFANGQKVLFNGYVGCTLLPTGSAQDKVVTSVVVTMYGRPSVYAS